ncbi:MAG: M23 family metallopeptidase [Acidobacteriota bacterium]
MRARGVLLFAAGAVTGALLFYSIAWRTGALVSGHWLSRTTRDVVPPRAMAPLPTIPFPTATATAASAPVTPPAPGAAADPPPAAPAPAATPPLVSSGLPASDLVPLRFPVVGAKISDLKDNFAETRDGIRRHEAIDILAPRGSAVLAVSDGTVAKLFTSVQGGLTIYEFNRDGTLCYYYAHLDRYAPGLAEGMALSRGDRIGEVGTTGNAPKNTPHLHFAIFRLGPDRKWWQGEPVNPYPRLLEAREN